MSKAEQIKEISEFNVSIVHNNSFDSDIEKIINETTGKVTPYRFKNLSLR